MICLRLGGRWPALDEGEANPGNGNFRLMQAIEEVLRYRGVVHTMPRVATRDTVLCGQEIKAGDLVLPLFASANLDEAHFPHADRFDIRRTPNRHLGFGYGIHFCLGASPRPFGDADRSQGDA